MSARMLPPAIPDALPQSHSQCNVELSMASSDPFYKQFMGAWFKLFSFSFNSTYLFRSHICRCHNSSCSKLWPARIIIFHLRAIRIFGKLWLWAHKSFLIWIPVSNVYAQWAIPFKCLKPNYIDISNLMFIYQQLTDWRTDRRTHTGQGSRFNTIGWRIFFTFNGWH